MPEYPLQQLEEIKKRRLEETEKILKEKKTVLEKEEKNLKELEAAFLKVQAHRTDKLKQLREEQAKESTTSAKMEEMKRYLKYVEEDAKTHKRKVDTQKGVVAKAVEAVEKTRHTLFQKQKEVEKLMAHKKEWKQGVEYEEARGEAEAADEMGTVRFVREKRKKHHGRRHEDSR